MHIKAIWDFITCQGCCCRDVSGMIIQDGMLMMADQFSGYDSSQTPSLRIRCISERANVWFPPYQDVWQLFIDKFIETQPCKLGWCWATGLLFVWMGSQEWGGSQAVHNEGYWPAYSGWQTNLDEDDWEKWSQTHESSFPSCWSEMWWTSDTTVDLRPTSVECIWGIIWLDVDDWARSSY